MKEVKKFLILSVLLVIYVFAIFLLLQSFYVYQRAYQRLSRMISHPSIEIMYFDSGQKEE